METERTQERRKENLVYSHPEFNSGSSKVFIELLKHHEGTLQVQHEKSILCSRLMFLFQEEFKE